MIMLIVALLNMTTSLLIIVLERQRGTLTTYAYIDRSLQMLLRFSAMLKLELMVIDLGLQY